MSGRHAGYAALMDRVGAPVTLVCSLCFDTDARWERLVRDLNTAASVWAAHCEQVHS